MDWYNKKIGNGRGDRHRCEQNAEIRGQYVLMHFTLSKGKDHVTRCLLQESQTKEKIAAIITAKYKSSCSSLVL